MKSDNLQDYYGLLGVPQNATVSEIHKAYWNRACRMHPDRGGSHEGMVRLVEAWKILSSPEKRSRYDQLIKYRHDGWCSRKFNEDVQDARKKSEEHAASSWAEFEEIYQKAFYTFNKDFYGEDIDVKASGPYSPLMRGEVMSEQVPGAPESTRMVRAQKSSPKSVTAGITKMLLFSVVIVAALLMYRYFIGIGRYVHLEGHNVSSVLILDTTSGTVYSMEKKEGGPLFRWKEEVPPLSRQKK